MKNCTKTQLVIYNSSSMKKNALNLCDLLKAAHFLCKLAQVMYSKKVLTVGEAIIN